MILNYQSNNFGICISLRCEWEISKLQTPCPVGSKSDIRHSMSCKKGNFETIRHNDLRDLTAKILLEVCYDIWYRDITIFGIEPKLVPLSGEDLSN